MSSDCRIKVLIAHRDSLVAAGAAAILGGDRAFDVLVQPPVSVSAKVHWSPGSVNVLLADYDLGLQHVDEVTYPTAVLIVTHLDGETHVRSAVERGIRGYLQVGCSVEALRQAVTSLYHGETAFSPLVASKIAQSLAHKELTELEMAVLRLIMRGLSNKAIAKRLAIYVGTVKCHVKSLFRKLEVGTRSQAAAVAHQRGLTSEAKLLPTATRTRDLPRGAIRAARHLNATSSF
jgi:DNA-binding NarL/FixJ family response regulator